MAISTLSDLFTTSRRTAGEVPPPMVGSSSTVIGSILYTFGGRPLDSECPTARLYALDLDSLEWSLVVPADGSPCPSPRYLHSATVWDDKLVIHGGEGPAPTKEGMPELGDVVIFDPSTRRWSIPVLSCAPGVEAPEPRCAHLTFVDSRTNELHVVGGQSAGRGRAKVEHLRDLAVLNLQQGVWVRRVEDVGRTVGTYRSAVAGEEMTFIPRRKPEDRVDLSCSIPDEADTQRSSFLLYSNSDLKAEKIRRDLDLFGSSSTSLFTSLSHLVSSRDLPPGLRFPSSFIVGRSLVVTGVQIDSTTGRASIGMWSLDLVGGLSSLESSTSRLKWKELDGGRVMKQGSWGRGLKRKNKLLFLGDGEGNMAKDYGRRQQSFSDLITIDLEAFGVYHPPVRLLGVAEQQLGLQRLEPASTSDVYTLVSSDQRRLKCSRRLLTHRWRWLNEQLESLVLSDAGSDLEDGTLEKMFRRRRSGTKEGALSVTPTAVHLPLTAPSALALLHYFATLTLSTPLQNTLSVLRSLLLFASGEKGLSHLRTLVIHALHDGLDDGSFAAAQVYEVAALGVGVGDDCLALQVRTLQGIMKDVGEPATVAARKRLSVFYPTSPIPAKLLGCDPPLSPPASIVSSIPSLPGSYLSPPRDRRRGSATSSTSSLSVDRRRPSLKSSDGGLSTPFEQDEPHSDPRVRPRIVSEPFFAPTSPGPPVFHLGPPPSRLRSSSAAMLPPTPGRETPEFLANFPVPPPHLPTWPLHLPALPESSTISAFSTRSLSIVVEAPHAGHFEPGDTITLALDPIAPCNISSFSAITAQLLATSIVDDGSLLPSKHTILDDAQYVDLESSSLKLRLVLPQHVACACRRSACVMPPSGRVVLKATDGRTLGRMVVEYTLEITVKRKGWGKSPEKLSFRLPFPVQSSSPFTQAILTARDVGSALASAVGASSSWRRNFFSTADLLAISGTSAELAHSLTLISSSVVIAWSLTIRLPEAEGAKLAQLLKRRVIEAAVGRKVIAIFDGEDVDSSVEAAELETINNGRPELGFSVDSELQLASIEVTGWLEVQQEDMRPLPFCNGHLQHVLIVRLPSFGDDRRDSLVLEASLFPSPTPALPPLPMAELTVTGNDGTEYGRPDPFGPLATFSVGMQRSASFSHKASGRSGLDLPDRRHSIASSSSSLAEASFSFARGLAAHKAAKAAREAAEAQELREMKLRAAKAAATKHRADATGRHLPYAGFFM